MGGWRELVGKLYPDHEFATGCSASDLAAAEERLGAPLPADLRELLGESNGVFAEYGLGLIWPLDRIVADNLAFRADPTFREIYMPFEPLVFFADAGNGDQFGVRVLDGRPRADVFSWDHEDDSRKWVAPDLRHYLEWWADGRIRL